MIGKHLKEYKKNYIKARREEPRKVRIKRNSDWKKRWIPFIKYDHDFDGEFFIELIVHKLHIMLDYYDHGKYCWQVDESRLEIVKSLQKACELGDKILEDDFDKDAYKVMEEHMTSCTRPIEGREDVIEFHMEWDSEENHKLYNELSKKADKEREKTIDEFFKYIRKEYRKWWD